MGSQTKEIALNLSNRLTLAIAINDIDYATELFTDLLFALGDMQFEDLVVES